MNWRSLGRLFKESGRQGVLLMSILVVRTLTMAIKSFVHLHFFSNIIDCIHMKQSADVLIAQVLQMTVIFLAIECLEHLASYCQNIRIREIVAEKNLMLSRKLMESDYEFLEDPATQKKVENLRQKKFQSGDLFEKAFDILSNFFVGLFTVVVSLFYVIQFMRNMIVYENDVLKVGIIFIVFLSLIFYAVVILLKNSEKHNNLSFKRFQAVAPINRLYSFYRRNIFQNYKYGKDIRIFDQRELIEKEFSGVTQEMKAYMHNIGYEDGCFHAMSNLNNLLLGSVVYMYVGWSVWAGVISVGAGVRYFGVFAQLLEGIFQLIRVGYELQGNEKFLQQYYELMDVCPIKRENKKISVEENIIIEFEKVSFQYEGTDRWILKDVSFKIHKGEHIAMVGRNGSGKTTCIRLLLRLCRPTKGRILLNNIDIQEYDIKEYWKLMSVVFQDFNIFSVELKYNILARESEENKQINKVLEIMGLDERVRQMYKGAESCLYKDYDENGVLISGGEAQKVAIARALYKDAPVFIMDEPSAALDPVSEMELYEKINTVIKEKTIILISHRLSSCCFCDRIMVLEEGEIVESGRHQELLACKGVYYRLWEAQARHYQYVLEK